MFFTSKRRYAESSCFFVSSRRRHTRWPRDWSSDVCSSDLPARDGDELDAVLLRAGGAPQPVDHPQPLEGEPGVGDERLSNVVTREGLPLEQEDAMAVLGQQGAGRRTRRPSANNHDVVFGHGHNGFLSDAWSAIAPGYPHV